ncbi:MAG: hypothetical protein BroJett003_01440 [Planctomycetota bacterium]|nr:MAG: hypothetical protein BroJett003_01440 [Planctomycetota bacterium]
MQYKTIILQLLRQRPKLHDLLRRKRKLLAVVDNFAGELKTRHESWKENLTEDRPDIDPSQAASAALEIALQEVESRLRLAFPPNDPQPLSLDAAIAFIRRHTSHA